MKKETELSVSDYLNHQIEQLEDALENWDPEPEKVGTWYNETYWKCCDCNAVFGNDQDYCSFCGCSKPKGRYKPEVRRPSIIDPMSDDLNRIMDEIAEETFRTCTSGTGLQGSLGRTDQDL